MTELQTEMFLQIGLAILCGGAVGLERGARGRAAGLRTMILVCLGSTVIMIVSGRLSASYVGPAAEAIVRIDPGRIAAGIVTGVGFLGAAVVVKLGDIVRGVTTAASIWFAAALGIVIGLGFYLLAVSALVVGLLVLWGLGFIEKRLPTPVYRLVTLAVSAERSGRILEQARQTFEDAQIRLMDLKAHRQPDTDEARLTFHIRAIQKFQAHEVVTSLGAIEGVRHVAWD